ncbi:AAA family ATPase [Dokdonella sp.]|uniref:AAA family ATPase n=1 Tax=Dokdonella sp. TaxID=2291710 RepID=UPI00378398D5
MLSLVLAHHPNCSLSYFRGILVGLLHDSILSKVGASGKAGAIQSAPKRDVYLLDIARTLPLDASAGYAKIARSAAAEVESSEINDAFRDRLSHVLGRQYSKARFATSDVDKKRSVGVLEREWGELSQFHQGAGEDATLDLFRTLQGLPENSLLLIDEVEASLHPRAQRRLVRFLLWLSRQRRIQVILSTH